MTENVHREIKALHTFFERWMRGELPNNRETFERCTGVLDPAFGLVSPGGHFVSREEIADHVFAAHGSQADPERPFRIWTQGFACRPLGRGRWLARYEEWQERDGATRARLSTAVFKDDATAPHGVVWEHVHETWMPDA